MLKKLYRFSFIILVLLAIGCTGGEKGLVVGNDVTYDVSGFTGIISATCVNNSTALVTWALHGGANQYIVYRTAANNKKNQVAVATKTSTSAQIDGLIEGETYEFMVRAVDQYGYEDDNTAVESVTIIDITPPTFDGLTSATEESGVITLTWETPTNGPSYYNVFACAGTDCTIDPDSDTPIDSPAAGVAATGYTYNVGDGLFGDEIPYTFFVQACDAFDNCSCDPESPYALSCDPAALGLTKSLTTSDQGQPEDPTVTDVSIVDGNIVITVDPWTHSDGMIDFREVRMYAGATYASLDDFAQPHLDAITYDATGLPNNASTSMTIPKSQLQEDMTYHIFVRDYQNIAPDTPPAIDSSIPIYTIQAGDLTRPIFDGITALTTIDSTTLRASAIAITPEDVDSDGATYYYVYLKEYAEGTNPAVDDNACLVDTHSYEFTALGYTAGDTIQFDLTDLTPKTRYDVCIKAVDEATNISETEASQIKSTYDETAPQFGGIKTAEYDGDEGGVVVTWTESSSTDVYSYKISAWHEGDKAGTLVDLVTTHPATSFVVKSAHIAYNIGDTIRFKVNACDDVESAAKLPYAYGSENCTDLSDEITLVVTIPDTVLPASPTYTLSRTSGSEDTSVDINFTAVSRESDDYSAGASHYLVYTLEGENEDACTSGSLYTSFSASSYSPGSDYAYAIVSLSERTWYSVCLKTRDSFNNKSISNLNKSIRTGDITAPIFNGLQAAEYNRTDSRVDLTWNASPSSDVASFKIKIWKNSETIADATTIDWDIASGSDGAYFEAADYSFESYDTLYIVVDACDDAYNLGLAPTENNCTAYTTPKVLEVPDLDPPVGFEGITNVLNISDGVVQVEWDSPASNSVAWNTYRGFHVYDVDTSDNSLTFLASCACTNADCSDKPYNCSIPDLDPYRLYNFHIRAYDSSNNITDYSSLDIPANSMIPFTTQDTTPPTYSPIITATYDEENPDEIFIEYYATANDNQYDDGTATITYEIFRKTDETFSDPTAPYSDGTRIAYEDLGSDATSYRSYSDTLISQGSTFYYTVCAKDMSNNRFCPGTVRSASYPDIIPPVISDVTKSADNYLTSEYSFTWTMTDNATPEYQLVVSITYKETDTDTDFPTSSGAIALSSVGVDSFTGKCDYFNEDEEYHNYLITIRDNYGNEDSETVSFYCPPDIKVAINNVLTFGESVDVYGNSAVITAPDTNLSQGLATMSRFDPDDLDDDGKYWEMTQIDLLPPDVVAGYNYGTSSAISGDVVVIGAWSHPEIETDGGAAYIYRFNGTSWELEEKLQASDTIPHLGFGWSVDISGDVLIVGTRQHIAYIYRYDAADSDGDSQLWELEKKISGDGFLGFSVATDGSTAAIGAYYHDDDAPFLSGAVYVYRFDGAAWTLEEKIVASDANERDEFGSKVAISDNLILVGAIAKDYDYATDGSSNEGGLYIFRYDPTDANADGYYWEEEAQLIPDDLASRDMYSNSIALTGDKVLSSAHRHASGGISLSGASYFYYHDPLDLNSNTVYWEEIKYTAIDADDSDSYGISNSMSGDTILIGANLSGVPGSAYFYHANSSDSEETITDYLNSGTDNFKSGAISGSFGIAGVPDYDADGKSNSGIAHIYQVDPLDSNADGNNWYHIQSIYPSDGASDDGFGISSSLSHSTAIIGSYQDDDFGPNSGSAYIFRFSGSTWREEEKLLPPEDGSDEWFGRSVDISASIAIVGSPKDDVDGADSGSAYIFRYDGTNWNREVKLTPSDGAAGDMFGYSVAIKGDLAIIGAYGADANSLSDSGKVYIFRLQPIDSNSDGTTDSYQWSEEQIITAPVADASASDYFGFSVDIESNLAVVGAYNDDERASNAGTVYVYRYINSTKTWTKETKLTANDYSAGAQFGYSVSVSENLIAVGANGDDLVSTDNGSVYIYRFDEADLDGDLVKWEEKKITSSSPGSNSYFGSTVSVSGNNVMVIQDNDSGYVFDLVK